MNLTWGQVIRIWWAHTWRELRLLFIPVVSWVAYAVFHPDAFRELRLPADVILLALAVIANIVTLRIVLLKTYSDFRIVVIPREAKL
jgi:hypothetical protein